MRRRRRGQILSGITWVRTTPMTAETPIGRNRAATSKGVAPKSCILKEREDEGEYARVSLGSTPCAAGGSGRNG
jgi:hypothetical protein